MLRFAFVVLIISVLSTGAYAKSEPKPATAPVILIAGDSLSAAYGIPREKSWPVLLEKRLQAEHYPHAIANISISGETTQGGLARFAPALKQHRPAIVIIELGANDGLRGLALETADTDITINTVCPSYVKTPLVDKQIADQARTRGISEADVVSQVMLKPMPKGVFIGLDELAGITAFLTSPAARNITGQTIVVDGGWTVQ